MSPTGIPAGGKVRCGQCGEVGHNRLTCSRPATVEKGVRVRRLAPGVSGAELAELDPIRTPPGAQLVPVILDVRVIITVEVRK